MTLQTKIWIGMLTLYLVWGSTYLAIRFAVETLPPFLMAGVRFLLAGGILYAWRRLSGDPAPSFKQWRAAGIIGSFLLLGGNGGVSWAEQHLPSSITALLIAATPLWIVLIDLLLPGGRQRVNWQIIAGVVIGFGGIVLLVDPGKLVSTGGALPLTGVVVILFAALSWAIGSVYARGATLPQSTLLGVSMQMLAGGAGLFLIALVTGETGRLEVAAISLRSIASVAYLVLVGALVGYVAYGWLLRNAPLPLVATYAYVNPMVAVLLGAWLAAEALNLQALAAAVIIVAAVMLINHGRSRLAAKPPASSPEHEIEEPAGG